MPYGNIRGTYTVHIPWYKKRGNIVPKERDFRLIFAVCEKRCDNKQKKTDKHDKQNRDFEMKTKQ